jgi:hypothetical protein
VYPFYPTFGCFSRKKYRNFWCVCPAAHHQKVRTRLTYEDLIVSIDNEAPNLPDAAYKLLWRLISIAIQRRSPQISVSHNWLAQKLCVSREGIARSARELRKLLIVESQNGLFTTFTIPDSWLSPQRSLFSDETPLTGRQAPAYNPGRPANFPGTYLPNFQAGPAHNPGRPANSPGSHLPNFQADLPNFQAGSTQNQQLTHRALIDIESNQNPAHRNFEVIIDRSLSAVEIPVENEGDAAILSDELYAYKCDFGPVRERSLYPDTKVLARCLALAPVERLVSVLRTLRSNNTRCGQQDMWFFTVFAQKIYAIPPRLTASRYDLMKPRENPPTNETPGRPSLFQENLLNETAAKVRRLG